PPWNADPPPVPPVGPKRIGNDPVARLGCWGALRGGDPGRAERREDDRRPGHEPAASHVPPLAGEGPDQAREPGADSGQQPGGEGRDRAAARSPSADLSE